MIIFEQSIFKKITQANYLLLKRYWEKDKKRKTNTLCEFNWFDYLCFVWWTKSSREDLSKDFVFAFVLSSIL